MQDRLGGFAAGIFLLCVIPCLLPLQPLMAVSLPGNPEWESVDIGDVGVVGSAEYDAQSGVYTVRGSGVLETYWSPEPDKFHFVYKQVSGDFVITARLLSTQDPMGVDESKAGLMIRESLDTDAAHVTLSVEPSAIPFYLFRRQTGFKPISEAKNVDPNSYNGNIPKWIRLVRYKNQISTYESEDGGNTWVTSFGGTLPSSLDTLYVGLISCASTQSMLNEATFDQVTIEPLEMDYQSHYVGNSFGGGGAFVQQAVDGMYVDPETGLVYVACRWDEGTRELGVYTTDGDFYTHCQAMHPYGGYAVAVSSKYIFTGAREYNSDAQPPYPTNEYGFRRYDLEGFESNFPGAHEGNWLIVSNSGHIHGLAVNDSYNELYVSRTYDNKVRVYHQDTMSQLREFNFTRPQAIAVAADDTLWIVNGQDRKVQHYDRFGNSLPEQITGLDEPRGIAISPLDGRIYVCENGWKNQILIYHSDGSFDSSFGVEGGVTVATTAGQTGVATTRGEIHPLKFNGPTGVGVDNAGNIYVGTNGPRINADSENTGSMIRKFDSSNNMLWQRYGLEFVDCADTDWDSDGVDVYTKHAHYVVDFNKAPGENVTYKGFTMDLSTYSNDWRREDDTVHYAGVMIRRLQGHKIMYITKQMGRNIYLYRFEPDSEIAVPSRIITASEPYGFYVDSQGDLWTRYQRHPFEYIDGNGNPVYGGAQGWGTPWPFYSGQVMRAMYEPETGRMFLTGYSPGNNNHGEWGGAGRELVCYSDWHGGRNVQWRTSLPYNHDAGEWPKSVDIAGDYVFVVMGGSATVHVYNKSNGDHARTLVPGPEVAGRSGWVDTVNGLRAYQRSNGEYLVFVEEDAYAKVIMYRFGGPEQPPAAPTNLVAQATTAISSELTWTDSSENEAGFRIERKLGDGSFEQIASAPMYSEYYQDSGLVPESTYTYRVASYNDYGQSNYSNEQMINTPPLPSIPDDPTDLFAIAHDTQPSIDVTWSDNSDDEEQFRIERKTGTESFAEVVVVPADVTTYLDTGLEYSTSYTYRVCALNIAGCSGYSNQAAATTIVSQEPVWIDDDDTRITYSYSWEGKYNEQYRYMGTFHEVDNTGAWVEMTFTGSSIAVIGELQPWGGPMEVYIDEQLTGTADCNGNTAYQQELFFHELASPGVHTIKLVSADSNWNYLDAFVYTQVAPPVPDQPIVTTTTAHQSLPQATLAWIDRSEVEDGFVIERRTGSSAYDLLDLVPFNQTSYVDTGVNYATTYIYRVAAYNSTGQSAFDEGDPVTICDPPPPNPPTGLSAVPADSKVSLYWNANTETNVLYYTIYKGSQAGGPYQRTAVAFGATHIIDSKVTNGLSYYYIVSATDTWSHESGFSVEVSVVPNEQVPPLAPYNLQAEPISDSQIDLTWTDGSQMEEGFIIERKNNGSGFEQVASPGQNETSHSDTGLTWETTYTYRIYAYNAYGNSGCSDEISARTLLPPPPLAPDGLTATARTINAIDLSWNDNSQDENGFRIERRTDGVYQVIAEVGADVSTYANLNLGWSTTYTYRVCAFNNSGQSDYSNEAFDTTPVYIVLQEEAVDDRDSSIIYTGSWNDPGSLTGRYNGTLHESSDVNATAEMTFTGVGVRLIGEKHSWGGEAEIFIDGDSQGIYSFNDPGQVLQAVIFEISDLPEEEHTIRIEHSGGSWIYVDAIIYSYYGTP